MAHSVHLHGIKCSFPRQKLALPWPKVGSQHGNKYEKKSNFVSIWGGHKLLDTNQIVRIFGLHLSLFSAIGVCVCVIVLYVSVSKS